jgi:hypothetical protein
VLPEQKEGHGRHAEPLGAEQDTSLCLFERREPHAALAADWRSYLEPGEHHIHEEEPTPFFVVMEGITEVLKDLMGRQTEVSEHKPGDFFGELAILMATAAPTSVRAKTTCLWICPRTAQFDSAHTFRCRLSGICRNRGNRHSPMSPERFAISF